MKNIALKIFTIAHDLPATDESPSPAMPSVDPKRFRRKFLVLAAVIAVAIILSALFIQQGSAVIPLNVDYQVGEKMVYDTTVSSTFEYYNSTLSLPTSNYSPNGTAIKSQQTIEVTDFDGEYYTLNHTISINLNNHPVSASLIEKMNKTGYSAYIINLGTSQQQVPNNGPTSVSYLVQLLNKQEVKVGDSIEVPFPISSSSVGITGSLIMTFKGFEDLTVPAGTYRVFRIDLTSNNLKMNYRPPINQPNITPVNISMGMDMNYQIYIEYGTMREIKASMQQSVEMQSSTLSYAMTMNMDMALVQHIKPQ